MPQQDRFTTPTLITIRLRLLSPGGLPGSRTRPGSGDDPPPSHLPMRRAPDGTVVLPGFPVAAGLRAHCAGRPGLPDGLFGGAPWEQETEFPPVQVLGVRLRDAPPGVGRLPAGTELDVYLRWDNAGVALEAFLDAVRAWRPCFGPDARTGAGICSVTGVESRSYDLAGIDGLLARLAVAGPETYPQPTAPPP